MIEKVAYDVIWKMLYYFVQYSLSNTCWTKTSSILRNVIPKWIGQISPKGLQSCFWFIFTFSWIGKNPFDFDFEIEYFEFEGYVETDLLSTYLFATNFIMSQNNSGDTQYAINKSVRVDTKQPLTSLVDNLPQLKLADAQCIFECAAIERVCHKILQMTHNQI